MQKVYKSYKQSRWSMAVAALISIVLGIVCIAVPETLMNTVAICIGVCIVLYGLFNLVGGLISKNGKIISGIIIGIIAIVAGILILANSALIAKYMPVLLGFLLIIASLSGILSHLSLIKKGGKSWLAGVLMSIAVLGLGLIVLLHPGLAGGTFGVLTGIGLLLNGITSVVAFIGYKKA